MDKPSNQRKPEKTTEGRPLCHLRDALLRYRLPMASLQAEILLKSVWKVVRRGLAEAKAGGIA